MSFFPSRNRFHPTNLFTWLHLDMMYGLYLWPLSSLPSAPAKTEEKVCREKIGSHDRLIVSLPNQLSIQLQREEYIEMKWLDCMITMMIVCPLSCFVRFLFFDLKFGYFETLIVSEIEILQLGHKYLKFWKDFLVTK